MKSLSLICLFCFLATAHAQTIYKTVDEEGKVFYSTSKPDDNSDAKIVDIPPEPSRGQLETGLQQQKELLQSMEKQQRKRQQEKQTAEELKQMEKKKQKMKQDTNTLPGLLF